MARTILHVDLDAFYASVEQRDDPRLRGLPVVVGGPSRRGVVCAASYEVRRFGVRSAMPMGEALRRCPHAVVLAPRFHVYAEVSRGFFGILEQHSPLVEGLSLDEAFLDVTGEERLLGDGPAIARAIKARVRAELGIVASVGVAPSKFVAKIASDVGKPDGLLLVPDSGVGAFLDPLPIGRLWGVGRVTESALAQLGLRTIADVRRAGEAALAGRLGVDGARRLCALARGEDERPVDPDRAPVSIGSEETFEEDLRDRAALHPFLLAHADRSCARARGLGLRAHTITLKIKFADFESVSRRTTLERPTSDGRLVGRTAIALLAEVPGVERRGVRLCGISLSGLAGRDRPRQLRFDEPEAERGEALGEALDRIAGKFGRAAVTRAVLLDEHRPRPRGTGDPPGDPD